ncbi:hypothetical protein ACDQ55_14995 [Chitinophaga sp. 30R24]|uniref:hypothetical protein n=1 Tax=Chitinophaga sp. 30R24 TaxID=3248838 RepID=UPI003B915F9A
MKTTVVIPGAMLLAALSLNACQQSASHQETKDSTSAVQETPVTVTDTTAVVADTAATNEKEITGKVKEIENGKDGYTAKIEGEDGHTYAATISRANLKDPAQYKTLNTGDKVTVKGDSWMMGEEERITVRELK